MPQKTGQSQLQYIIGQLQELARLGHDEYTGSEMAEAIEGLLEEITPKKVFLYAKHCTDFEEHPPHVYFEDGTEYYCPANG